VSRPEGDADREVEGFPVSDWRYEVANGDTYLGYAEWAEARKTAEAG
jgi:hypothetical protein